MFNNNSLSLFTINTTDNSVHYYPSSRLDNPSLVNYQINKRANCIYIGNGTDIVNLTIVPTRDVTTNIVINL